MGMCEHQARQDKEDCKKKKKNVGLPFKHDLPSALRD
jgi:hypothetical protein